MGFLNRYSFFVNSADAMFFMFVIIPIFVLSIIVSIKLKLIYSKYSKIKNSNNVSGAVVARNILDSYGLQHVRVEAVYGDLTDHFDPTTNVVRLSYNNYEGTSIAAIGVAAHEVGHAIQYAKEYFPIKVRAAVIPATKFGSMFSIPIFMLGMMLANIKLAYFGIILFGLVALFQLITLPVEFNASIRAVKIIRAQKILDLEEIKGVKKVLWAAAMTYVASLISTLAQLIRLIIVANSNNSKDD